MSEWRLECLWDSFSFFFSFLSLFLLFLSSSSSLLCLFPFPSSVLSTSKNGNYNKNPITKKQNFKQKPTQYFWLVAQKVLEKKTQKKNWVRSILLYVPSEPEEYELLFLLLFSLDFLSLPIVKIFTFHREIFVLRRPKRVGNLVMELDLWQRYVKPNAPPGSGQTSEFDEY